MRRYTAKILLFGEYSIIHGSDALVIPFSRYTAQFDFMDKKVEKEFTESNKTLKDLYQFLVNNRPEHIDLDLEMFREDIRKGIFFRSEIPVQYGIGSSGALVAAIFDRYGPSVKDELDPAKLRTEMGRVESFFHGKSSAVDPLCIFYNAPILFTKDKISFPEFKTLYPVLDRFFLLDTKIKGSTGKYIKLFQSLLADPSFSDEYKRNYLPDINRLYSEIKDNNQSAIKEIIRRISVFQLKHFEEMIPEPVREIWTKGILSDNFYLKLCGSGGGGFFQVYSNKDLNSLNENMDPKLFRLSKVLDY